MHRVDFLNQSVNIRGHDEQIPDRTGSRIPIGMRRSPRYEHTRAGLGLDFVLSHQNAQRSFKHMPCFVVAMVHMQWRDKPGGSAGPPASCHSAMTKASPTDPRTFPERGAAIIGDLVSRFRVSRFRVWIRGCYQQSIAQPSAPCAIASPASVCGTGMAGTRAGAPRQAPALNPSLTSLKMVRRFCAITFNHAIFPIMGK